MVWILVGSLVAGCGEGPASADARAAGADAPAWPIDGFLHHTPESPALVARLPRRSVVASKPDAVQKLLDAFGVTRGATQSFFGVEDPQGVDEARAPGYARTTKGVTMRFLPIADKAALNRALQPMLANWKLIEHDRWAVLARGAPGNESAQKEPLLPGDVAVRVHNHPVLSLAARPGDVLDLGATLHASGCEFEGRLRAGPTATDDDALARAAEGYGGMLEHLPGWLALRIEMTLPPTACAALVARRFAFHCGIQAPADRVVLERLLREALSGVRLDAGLGLGVEFREGRATIVCCGTLEGPNSPILTKLRNEDRTSFGAIVFDLRDADPRVDAWSLWIVEPKPKLEGLPECLWPIIAAATEGEDGPGLDVAYTVAGRSFACAVGPRADFLVRAVARRFKRGAKPSSGTNHLWHMRQRGEGGYIGGIVFESRGLAGLNPDDREGLRALFFGGAAATAPQVLAAALFRDGKGLRIAGRLIY
ncbi:MAG: hypothetical protein OER88_06800 [Planctomycetota bacterium]|nr:hypothetical protein [Planctomycetota bacterium]